MEMARKDKKLIDTGFEWALDELARVAERSMSNGLKPDVFLAAMAQMTEEMRFARRIKWAESLKKDSEMKK